MIAIILIILTIFVITLTALWIGYVKLGNEDEQDFYSMAKSALKKQDLKSAETFLLNFIAKEPS